MKAPCRISGSRVESRFLSRVESRLLSRVESRLLSRGESRLLSRVESRLLSRVEIRLLSRVEIRLLSRQGQACTALYRGGGPRAADRERGGGGDSVHGVGVQVDI